MRLDRGPIRLKSHQSSHTRDLHSIRDDGLRFAENNEIGRLREQSCRPSRSIFARFDGQKDRSESIFDFQLTEHLITLVDVEREGLSVSKRRQTQAIFLRAGRRCQDSPLRRASLHCRT